MQGWCRTISAYADNTGGLVGDTPMTIDGTSGFYSMGQASRLATMTGADIKVTMAAFEKAGFVRAEMQKASEFMNELILGSLTGHPEKLVATVGCDLTAKAKSENRITVKRVRG